MGLLSNLSLTLLVFLFSVSFISSEDCTNRRIYIRKLPAQFNGDLLHRQTLTNPFLSPNSLFPHLSFNGIGPKTHKRTHSWYRTDHHLIEPFFHRRLLEYPCLVRLVKK
ncbi:hypothetical protein ZOSMA_306G00250 [Zostera marina]|uniref:Uncharacterized protein n=1 Tax=Zostera marina TaxID=29655 RepID=A0A0K9PCH0_ZOSMR|nr:hypothetical protein ZOSMA_306G00250 [Zostera marina]